MNRVSKRIFLTTVAIAFATLGMGAALAECGEQQVKNVLLLYVDDLRPEIKCYGKSKLVTPNLDKLAGRSLVFNKAYCQIPICMPSRVSTLSGMYARNSGQGKLRTLLPIGRPSLPGYFRAKGYDTISIGKVEHEHDNRGEFRDF